MSSLKIAAWSRDTSLFMVYNDTVYFPACGGEIDAASVESGAFAHPGYPGDYERYRRCEYVIRTRPDSRIRLDFDRFDLEGASDCRYDSVEIRDGERGTNELIGKYCGRRNLTNIVSKSNVLYVKFVSDSTTQFKGFLAKWRRVSPFATTKKPGKCYSFHSSYLMD